MLDYVVFLNFRSMLDYDITFISPPPPFPPKKNSGQSMCNLCVCVCVCVHVTERETERGKAWVCVCVCMCLCEHVCLSVFNPFCFMLSTAVPHDSDLQQSTLDYMGASVHCAMWSRKAELEYLRRLTEKLFPYILRPQALHSRCVPCTILWNPSEGGLQLFRSQRCVCS